ncbi:MAG: DNA translocase FtsK 4TM domain-containing protein, partial [Anaerolineales bacterium]
MARKSTKNTPKRSGARSGSTSKPPAARGKSAAGKRAPARAARSTARKRPVSKQPAVKSAPSSPITLISGLSLDRKLDIAGVLMSLLGLFTLLSLVSTNRGSLTGGWVTLLARVFGWGVYLLPLTLIVVGLWLILRNFERIPMVSVERLVGISLLYANLLTAVHFFLFPESRQASLDLAVAGAGGGYLGAFVLGGLLAVVGLGGTGIALLAWFLIALIFTLDVSILDLFRWISPLVRWVQDRWDEFRARRAAAWREASPPYTYTPLEQSPGTVDSGEAAAAAGPNLPGLMPLAPDFMATSRPWILPNLADILDEGGDVNYDDEFDQQRARVIEETLASFGAPANVVEISRGPTITQFGVEPDFIESRSGRMRVRVGKISALADDLALALSARTIRIQAPVPGKGFVGIEVPNEEISLVALRSVLESEAFQRLKSPLRFALGQDVAGNAVAADLAAMPHLLIAGATGSGKSVCVNSLIACLLLNNTPEELRILMVDPKRVELTGYNGIPHLLAPVVVELERVVAALQWVTREMDQRYHKLAQAGCRNIKEYNAKLAARAEKKLPQLVVIIDELADLMMLAPDETERTITRLAQLARATGIHLVIATQRPSVDVVTGLIKANFPARVAFAVASGVDSRVILDQPGAERLLGRGDMLFQAPDAAAPVRLQGAFVSDNEIQRLVYYWQAFLPTQTPAPSVAGGIVDALPSGVPLKQIPLWDEIIAEQNADPLLAEAIDLIRRQGRASISMLQRRLRIGYTRAARLIETLEERGIVGPP